MAAPQTAGAPETPAAPPQAPESSGDARTDMIAAIAREMKAPSGGEDGADDPEDDAESQNADAEPEKKPSEPEKTEEKPKEEPKPSFDLAGAKKKVAEALAGLTDEQKDQVFAATSDAFAALHAREKRLGKRERAFVAEKTALDAERAETQSLRGELDQELTRGKENPLAALELFGWTLEDAHAYAINDNTIPHEKRMKLLEERTEKALAERMAKLKAHEDALAERERQADEVTWRNGVSGDVDAHAQDNVRWYIARMPNGKQAVVDAVMQMQTAVHKTFKGQKTLDVRTALARLERDVADARRVWASDPQREGAVQPANLEAGKPETRIPSASSGERPRPSNGTEEYDRDDLLREIVEQMRRG